jgi:hypothetical protein
MIRALIVLIITLCISGTAWMAFASEDWMTLPTYPHGKGSYSGTGLCGTRFVTEDDPEAVLAYYRDALPRIGWTYSPSRSAGMRHSIYFQHWDYFAIITVVEQEANPTTVLVVMKSENDSYTHCADGLD